MPNRNPQMCGLTPFFDPRSIAVIGSLKEGYLGGYVVVKTLLKPGFAGGIYPVNPSYRQVPGQKVYASIKEIPEKIDLALIIIGCRPAAGVLRECGEKGIRAVVNDYMSIYSEILKTVTIDPCIDSIFNVIWTGPSGEFMEEYLKIYRGLQGNPKPIASWIYGPRVSYINEMTCHLEDLGFPVFPDIEMAIKALGTASQYAKTKGGDR